MSKQVAMIILSMVAVVIAAVSLLFAFGGVYHFFPKLHPTWGTTLGVANCIESNKGMFSYYDLRKSCGLKHRKEMTNVAYCALSSEEKNKISIVVNGQLIVPGSYHYSLCDNGNKRILHFVDVLLK